MKKKLSIVKKILNVTVIIFVISFLLMVILQRFSNNEISFFNYRMFTVASGSMAPQYEVGDVLIAKETAPEKIKVGDSISYLGTQGTFSGKVVTHEVTSIEKDVDGNYVFHTKGIANLVEDPPVYYDQIYGVIVWQPKILSFIYKVINTKYGLFLFIVLPIFYIIGSEMLSAMLEKEEERRQKLQEKREIKEEIKQPETSPVEEPLEESVETPVTQVIEVTQEKTIKKTRQKKEKLPEESSKKEKTTKKTSSSKTTTKKESAKKENVKKTTTKKETTKKETAKKETTKKSTSTKKKETK